MSLRFKAYLWLPVVVFAALIFYLSAQPQLGELEIFPFFDKILHAVEYAIFAFLLMRAIFNSRPGFESRSALYLSIISAFIYAITDEIHQAFVPGRTAELLDLFFDLIGAGIGSLFYERCQILGRLKH